MRPAGLALVLACLLGCTGSARPAIQLASPVACTFGQNCWIQQYADRDTGPAAQDYKCGAQSYEGHDGTDFRVADMAAVRAGVNVLATAPGVVRGVRDGMADISSATVAPGALTDRECGNGVVIAHAGGWETQYCHMASGSVKVSKGQAVVVGQALGRVGMSGMAEFPHLHLSVRQNGNKIDPFDAAPVSQACAAAATSLWTPAARSQMAYREQAIITAGFTTEAVGMEALLAGTLPQVKAHSTAMVAYALAIHLKAGDVMTVMLTGPDGAQMAIARTKPMDRNKAQYMAFAGARLKRADWPQGSYKGRAVIERAGREISVRDFVLTL